MLLEKLNGNENRKFILIDDPKTTSKILNPILIYVRSLLKYLWDDPKLVSILLINSNIVDVKKYLAPFFVHNFYENILSSNSIENNLFSLITFLLKNEINNDEINEKNFLKNTPCAYILEELKYKNDIRSFFNFIINDIVEKIETSSTKELNFDIIKIKEKFILSKMKTNEKLPKDLSSLENKRLKTDINSNKSAFFSKRMKIETSKVDNQSIIITDDYITDYNLNNAQDKNSITFFTKYMLSMPKKTLDKKISEYKKESYIKDYINYQLKMEKNNDDYIFSNENLMQDIMNSGKLSHILLTEYSNSFFLTIEIIDIIFEKLLSNIDLMPYSIKYISKIIFQLVENMYENEINEENLEIMKCIYLFKFFFNILFIPILKNPTYISLISNIIVSDTTIKNIQIISEILSQLVSFKFFKNIGKTEYYTPFNWYFLDKIPQLFKLMNEISNIELPNFIENCIDDPFSEDYIYNYFDENKDEIIFYRSICYSTDDICILIKNINQCKNIIFDGKNTTLKKIFEKISIDNSNFINTLQNVKEYVTENNNKNKLQKENSKKLLKKYFLMSDFMVNDKYTNLFEMSKDNYNIKQSIDNKEQKMKHYLCILLYNLCILNPNDFKKSNNIIDLLKQLKNYCQSSTYIIDKNFHAQWYIDSVLQYIKKIPENLVQNNYNELFEQLINQISGSISRIKFEIMSICHDKLRIIQKNTNIFDLIKEKIIDIDLNKKVKSIVENTNIFTTIFFKFNDDVQKFTMSSEELNSQFLDEMIFQKPLKNIKVCENIKSFIKNFPNLVKYQEYKDINTFEIIKKLEIQKKLFRYFENIKDYIQKFILVNNQKETSIIYSKIYDYIMEKLYSKIFPIEPSTLDIKIYQNCVKLSWIEPKHLIIDKNHFVYEHFLPEIFNYFNKMCEEKSPRKKFIYINKLYKTLLDINAFNGGKELDIDCQISIMTYVIIKAQPFRFFSNCEYMKVFFNDIIEGKNEDSRLTQLLSICQIISDFKYGNAIGINEEEFLSNCKNSIKQ